MGSIAGVEIEDGIPKRYILRESNKGVIFSEPLHWDGVRWMKRPAVIVETVHGDGSIFWHHAYIS